jgi:septum formation protein
MIASEVVPSDIDETALPGEAPSIYVRRIALEKARKVASSFPNAFIVAADTAVAKGRVILPKAEDDETVLRCLRSLSGARHTVYTGVCVIAPGGTKSCRHVDTRVSFKRLAQEELQEYVASQEGIGKAGGYAIQGKAGKFVQWINGSYSAVVGLPLYETCNMLDGLGYKRSVSLSSNE